MYHFGNLAESFAMSDEIQPDKTTAPRADSVAPPHTVVQVGMPDVAREPGLLPAVAGYELSGEIGSGGMGVVYAARDLALNRSVAVKLLRHAFPAAGAAVQRFLDEAQITGQLQHPGIPPVHQVGTLPDGRPFLAMKLIKGRTLHALLGERGSPADGLARFVTVFEQICLAVGYAHSRNVVHRDLKPANVMVGAFGEVQVMDWGLAKVVGAATDPRPDAPASGTTIRSVRELGAETQAGSVLGSPAFMPPEQAGGEVARIDPRTDVFGLGAVLCSILTGQAPYTGSDLNELHLKAIRGQTGDAFARLDACGAEPGLVALAKRCLATDPAERPADGGAVAAVVASLRADAARRARQAELDRVRAEGELAAARATAVEQRKRRRVQLALLASVALFAFAGGAFAWREDRRATTAANEAAFRAQAERADADRRKAHTEREVTAALAELNALCDRGAEETDNPPRWRLTLAAARSAHHRAAAALGTGPASGELLATFHGASARLAQDGFDCETAERCERWFVDVLRAASRNPRPSEFTGVRSQAEAIFARLGAPPATDALVAAVRGHRLRYPLTVLALIAGQMDDDGRLLRKYREAVARDAHPLQPAVRAALDAQTGLDDILVGSGKSLTSNELVVLYLACSDPARWPTAASPLLHEALRRNPADLVALVLAAGESTASRFEWVGKENAPRPPDPFVSLKHSEVRSIAASAAAVAVRPDVSVLWSQYGKQLDERGLSSWAADCFRRAVQLDPDRGADYHALANIYLAAGRPGDAVGVFRTALQRHLQVRSGEDELPVEAARAALLLAYGSGPDSTRLTQDGKRELRREAAHRLRVWLTEWDVTFEGLSMARADPAFRFVRHPLYLAALDPTEASEWLAIWAKYRSTPWKTKRTFEFVGPAIVAPLPVAPSPREVSRPGG